MEVGASMKPSGMCTAVPPIVCTCEDLAGVRGS
jgi:hypothetical protein